MSVAKDKHKIPTEPKPGDKVEHHRLTVGTLHRSVATAMQEVVRLMMLDCRLPASRAIAIFAATCAEVEIEEEVRRESRALGLGEGSKGHDA